MRLAVKPHQAFLQIRCPRRGPSTPPASCRFGIASPLLSSRAFFPRRRSPLTLKWGRAASGKECSFASPTRRPLDRDAVAKTIPFGGRVLRAGRQARTTVYPCGTCYGPKHLLPCTP